jgi:2-polyprenyl-6-methoxyphenol hydroxylase-like FAD-dependent oxidoreductase
MNLGIKDAAAFAEAANRFLAGDKDAIDVNAEARHHVHKTVVGRIERLTFAGRGRPDLVGVVRNFLFPALTSFGPSAHSMLQLVTGLDHDAPGLRKEASPTA